MLIKDLRRPVGVAKGLALLVCFLPNFSCGQDPAFGERNFTDGTSAGDNGENSAQNSADLEGAEAGTGTVTGTGAGQGGEGNQTKPNPYLPTTPDEVVSACNLYERQTYQTVLNFPERENCSWNQNGNGERRNEFMQAREAQTRGFSLPTDAVLCSLELDSHMSNLHYDDFIFFMLNDRVLMGSNGYFVNMLQTQGGIHIWDWAQLFGKAWQETGPYCLAGSSSCTIPPHDVPGAVNLALSTGAISEIALQILTNKNVDFTLIATGDNDDADCFHSNLDMNMSAEYVVVPNNQGL